MGKGLKFLLAGVMLGLMAVFALIGVKSVLDDKKSENTTTAELVQPDQEAVITPQVGTSQTMADQTEQKPADTTQLTPAQTAKPDQENTTTEPKAKAAESASTDQEQTQAAEKPAEPTESTQSTQEEAKLDMQLIDEFGGLQLTLSDPAAPGKPARGQFVIRDAQDQVVANMKDTDTASFDLSPGIYEVTVIAKGKKSARMVRIVTGEFVTEHFELPTAARQAVQQAQQSNQQAQTQQANNQATGQQTQAAATQAQQGNGNGKLAVVVQAAGSNAPLKSNIYVQLPNGKHVTKKNYADFANFELRPGTYKVTVKAQGKVDVVRNVKIQKNGSSQEVFSMQSPAAQAPVKPAPPPEGTLTMELRSPADAKNPSRGRFVIQDANGKRVTRMRGVSNAEIKLKPGRYNVVAVHRGSRLSKPVNIVKGRASRIVFNVNEFPRQAPAQQNQGQQQAQQQPQVQVPAQRGVLQLIAVSGVNQQPLKVNFLISTLDGRRLKSAQNVSVTELSLPPQDVLVDISYEEMRGQERIKVKSGEPTVFTFTVSPNNQAQAPIDQIQQQAPQSLEDMLLERLQQEILQRIN